MSNVIKTILMSLIPTIVMSIAINGFNFMTVQIIALLVCCIQFPAILLMLWRTKP